MDQNLLMFAALAFFVVMMVMNSRKRKKQQSELETALKPGAWIMLNSGIVGELKEFQDDRAIIESTPGNQLLVAKAAIMKVVDAPAVKVAPAAKAAKAAPAAKPGAKKAPAAAAKKPAVKKPAAQADKN